MTFHLRQFLSAAIVFCAVCTAATASEKKPCTDEEAKRADSETDALKTWNSVYSFYKQFSQCDDGGVAEGISEAVAKKLANQWDSVGELVKLGSKDKGFEDFVVRHVDETIDWDRDAPKIHENAKLHCPANSRRLCKALVERTTPQKK
jgi:hypothetical protein